jgi:small subunit ribosomal protein S9
MAKQTKIVPDKQEVKTPQKDYIFAIGRRKEAVARVRLYQNNDISWDGIVASRGDIFVNKKKALEYFGEQAIKVYGEPLRVTNTENKFAITVKAEGGGKAGQLDAVVLAIARALDKLDKEKFHSILRKKGFLTRDSRVRQRRKVGMGGKSRRRKQSPKR